MDLARLSEGNEAAPPDGRGLHEGTCLLQHLEAHTGSALTINIGFCFLLHCRKWQTALLLLTRRGGCSPAVSPACPLEECGVRDNQESRILGRIQREPWDGREGQACHGWDVQLVPDLTAPGRTDRSLLHRARTQQQWHKDFWEGKQGSHLLPTWRLGLRAFLPPMECSRVGRRGGEV